MPRTVLTPQALAAKDGTALQYTPADVPNGMEFRNTGGVVVAVVTGTGSSVIVKFPSVADAFNRTGDVIILQTTPSVNPVTKYYGPFNPSNIWGDGASKGFIDFSGLAGSVSVAVISI